MCGNMIYMTIVSIMENFDTVLNRRKGEFQISKCSPNTTTQSQAWKEITFSKWVM